MTVYAQLTPEHQLDVLSQLNFQDEDTISEERLRELLRNILKGKNRI